VSWFVSFGKRTQNSRVPPRAGLVTLHTRPYIRDPTYVGFQIIKFQVSDSDFGLGFLLLQYKAVCDEDDAFYLFLQKLWGGGDMDVLREFKFRVKSFNFQVQSSSFQIWTLTLEIFSCFVRTKSPGPGFAICWRVGLETTSLCNLGGASLESGH
jgi:hypothetical protein